MPPDLLPTMARAIIFLEVWQKSTEIHRNPLSAQAVYALCTACAARSQLLLDRRAFLGDRLTGVLKVTSRALYGFASSQRHQRKKRGNLDKTRHNGSDDKMFLVRTNLDAGSAKSKWALIN